MSEPYIEAARRFYWNGSLDGGLGCDTDAAEQRDPTLAVKIKLMADFAAALVRREVEAARADEREDCAKTLDEHGRDRQPQYHDLYMQEVTQYARRGGSHPATVRFAARWLAAAIRART